MFYLAYYLDTHLQYMYLKCKNGLLYDRIYPLTDVISFFSKIFLLFPFSEGRIDLSAIWDSLSSDTLQTNVMKCKTIWS